MCGGVWRHAPRRRGRNLGLGRPQRRIGLPLSLSSERGLFGQDVREIPRRDERPLLRERHHGDAVGAKIESESRGNEMTAVTPILLHQRGGLGQAPLPLGLDLTQSTFQRLFPLLERIPRKEAGFQTRHQVLKVSEKRVPLGTMLLGSEWGESNHVGRKVYPLRVLLPFAIFIRTRGLVSNGTRSKSLASLFASTVSRCHHDEEGPLVHQCPGLTAQISFL